MIKLVEVSSFDTDNVWELRFEYRPVLKDMRVGAHSLALRRRNALDIPVLNMIYMYLVRHIPAII